MPIPGVLKTIVGEMVRADCLMYQQPFPDLGVSSVSHSCDSRQRGEPLSKTRSSYRRGGEVGRPGETERLPQAACPGSQRGWGHAVPSDTCASRGLFTHSERGPPRATTGKQRKWRRFNSGPRVWTGSPGARRPARPHVPRLATGPLRREASRSFSPFPLQHLPSALLGQPG